MASPIQRYTEAEATPAKLRHARLYAQCTGQSDYRSLQVDQYGNLQTTATINGSDIQLGAVELKDHDSDNRADIGPAGDAVGNGVQALTFRDAGGLARRALVDAADHQQVDVLSSALPAGAATEASLGTLETTANAIQTAVEIMDDWDSNNRAKTSPIAGQDGVAANTGASDALTQRVVAASDSPEVIALEIMDDWDESNRAKVNPIVGQAGIAGNTGTSDALTTRTVAASNSPDVTALEIMDDWDESNRAKVNPIVGQAGIAAGTGVDGSDVPRVSLATDVPLPAGTNLLGTVGIDQTTPGTTDHVSPISGQNGVAANAGDVDALTQRVIEAANNAAVTLRSSAALTSADVTSAEVAIGNANWALIIGVYTRGTTGGIARVLIERCFTTVLGDTWVAETQIEPGALASGSNGVDTSQKNYHDIPSVSASAEVRSIPIPTFGASKMRVTSREIGVPGTPGTLGVYAITTNRIGQLPTPSDSKAYVPSTDSRRVENISPDPYVLVDEPLGVNATNLSAATRYYPSSAGGPMGPYNKITVDFTVSGGVTVTFEVSFDGGTVWKDITLYMTDLQTGLAGTASFVDTSACLYGVVNAPLWRVVYITSDAGNDIEISVRRKA